MNLHMSVWMQLRQSVSEGALKGKGLLSMAIAMRESFSSSFEDLMTSSNHGLKHVMTEVAPFHIPAGSVEPNRIIFGGRDSKFQPPGFRCMLLACLRSDSRLQRINGIEASVRNSIDGGQDVWLLIGGDSNWYQLTRTFTFEPGSEQDESSPRINRVLSYDVRELFGEQFAEWLERSPTAIHQMAKAFGLRAECHIDSLKIKLDYLKQIALFGEIYGTVIE